MEKDGKNCFGIKNMILNCKRHVEHPFAGWNTQHLWSKQLKKLSLPLTRTKHPSCPFVLVAPLFVSVLVQHCMPIVDVSSLFLHLFLPLGLLISQPVYHRLRSAISSHRSRSSVRLLRSFAPWALVVWQPLIVVLSVIDACSCAPEPRSLVEDRVKAWEEAHVNDENGDDPNDQDHHHLDDGQAPGFEFAGTPESKYGYDPNDGFPLFKICQWTSRFFFKWPNGLLIRSSVTLIQVNHSR